MTPLGDWGPWINGGAWLTVAGSKVDFLYRDLGRVPGLARAPAEAWSDLGRGDAEGALRRLRGVCDGLRGLLERARSQP